MARHTGPLITLVTILKIAARRKASYVVPLMGPKITFLVISVVLGKRRLVVTCQFITLLRRIFSRINQITPIITLLRRIPNRRTQIPPIESYAVHVWPKIPVMVARVICLTRQSGPFIVTVRRLSKISAMREKEIEMEIEIEIEIEK